MLGRPTNYRARDAGARDDRRRHRLFLTAQVDQTARPPVQRRPRFDGDVSELPDRACWALQHLLTRRYISAEADADVYSWVLEYRKELSVRLSELDLLLRIVDGTDVAFVEQARYESARGIKLLRREPLGTYDSILALHLAQMMRANAGQAVVISHDEMHGLFSGVLNDTDRDAVTFAARIDGAIARLAGLEILRKSRDDEDIYTISPVITAIMTASVITELQQQFEQLLTGGAKATPASSSRAPNRNPHCRLTIHRHSTAPRSPGAGAGASMTGAAPGLAQAPEPRPEACKQAPRAGCTRHSRWRVLRFNLRHRRLGHDRRRRRELNRRRLRARRLRRSRGRRRRRGGRRRVVVVVGVAVVVVGVVVTVVGDRHRGLPRGAVRLHGREPRHWRRARPAVCGIAAHASPTTT